MGDLTNKEIKLFIRPNCEKSERFSKNASERIKDLVVIDVTTKEGSTLADQYGILKLPAALIFDKAQSFIDRAYTYEGLLKKINLQENRSK